MADPGGAEPAAAHPPGGPRQFVPALQSLRGLAALWVVLYHVDLVFDSVKLPLLRIGGVRVGWLGVDLFFVLSAYLLGQPFLEGRSPGYWPFLKERLLRIAPAYYASGAVSAAVTLALLPQQWDPLNALWSLVFLNNSTAGALFALNPVFWSLAVEVQFYLLLPWMARLFRGERWPWALAACLAVSLLWRGATFLWGTQQAIVMGTFWLPAFLGHFGLGLAAARLRTVPRPFLTAAAGVLLIGVPVSLWIAPTSVVFWPASMAGHVMVRPLAAAGFALIVLAAASAGPVRRALEVRPLTALGDMSYSLYLIHLSTLVVVLWAVGLPQNRSLFAWLGPAAALTYGATFYGLVERPAELWRRRRRVRSKAAQPTPPA